MKHLVVIIGALVCWEAYGQGGRPPNYSQDQMPVTSFSCRDKILGGYYADPETQCQMFHVCVKVPGLGVQDYKFLCPNDTSFDQENQICDDWYNIDCEASTLYYSDNFDLYRIGSDFIRDTPRLSSNNINNAVTDVDDDNYLQRSDRGENVGSDLLRGSHSGNFFSNKHRGREEEDLKEELHKKKKAGNNKSQVRKLLTGKRPVSTSEQVPYQGVDSQGAQAAQQSRTNFAGRNRGTSNFQRNQPVTEANQRQTEVYNNQRQNYNNPRHFYTPTTPKVETIATQKTDYYKNNFYNPVTQQSPKTNFHDTVQTYKPPIPFSQTNGNFVTSPTNKFSSNFQTTRNTQSYQTSTTEVPVSYSSQPPAPEKLNNYETQKLFKINTAAFNQQDQYDDSKDDEFLKTAHSQNLGASNLNRVQNTIKQWNANLTASYNFYQTTSTKPNSVYQQNYNPTTLRPSSQFYTINNKNNQKENAYTPNETQKPYQQPQNNFFSPSTTQKYQQPNSFGSSSTPLKTPSQHFNSFFSPSTTQKPYQQTQNSFYTPSTTLKPTQQQSSSHPSSSTFKLSNNYYTTASPSTTYQQRTFNQQTSAPNTFPQNNNFRSPTPKPYQEFHRQQDNYFAGQQNKYEQTTLKPRSRGGALYSHTTDATESPRPFTVPAPKQPESKDKEQYDYAYYDDGAQGPEYDVDNLDFARTKSKS